MINELVDSLSANKRQAKNGKLKGLFREKSVFVATFLCMTHLELKVKAL